MALDLEDMVAGYLCGNDILNVKRYIVYLLSLIIFTVQVNGQDSITSNPDSAIIISSDIDNFWKAFDSLEKQKSTIDSLKMIRTIFVDHASEGLRQYMKAANFYEGQYPETIRKKKKDYQTVRENTGCETDAMEKVDITPQTIHELAHFQQKDQNPNSNLGLAMIEGGAEFVSYQVTGKRMVHEHS